MTNTNTPSNLNASAMLSAFIEAGNALEELPKVRDELAKAQTEAAHNADLYLTEAEANAKLAAELAEARATIAAKEADLSDLTFRHQQTENKLRTVADALGLGLPQQPAQPGSQSGGMTQAEAPQPTQSGPTEGQGLSQDQRDADPTSHTSPASSDPADVSSQSAENSANVAGEADHHAPEVASPHPTEAEAAPSPTANQPSPSTSAAPDTAPTSTPTAEADKSQAWRYWEGQYLSGDVRNSA